MTVAQLQERLFALEKRVDELQAEVRRHADPRRPWWLEDAGRFADDPVFEEIVQLGREYQRSLRPGRNKAEHDPP